MEERVWIDAAGEENLDRIVGRIRMLPVMPWVVTRLLEVIENENASAESLAEVIASDQTMTARVLKMVNSAFYGFPRRVTTVSEAVVILGFNAVRSLVISLSIADMFGQSERVVALDRKAFWLHSIGCAVASREIAKALRYERPEEAFVAGLLHDIGKAIFNEFAEEDYAKVIRLVNGRDSSLHEAERLVFGFDHGIMGAWLSNKWGLPSTLQRVIAYHHRTEMLDAAEDETADRLGRIVALADAVCKLTGIGQAGDHTVYRLPHPRGSISHETVHHIADALPQLVMDTAANFGFTQVSAEEFGVYDLDPSGSHTGLVIHGREDLSIARLVLERSGWHVVSAYSLEEGASLLASTPAALVVWEGDSPIELASALSVLKDDGGGRKRVAVLTRAMPDSEETAKLLYHLSSFGVDAVNLPDSLYHLQQTLTAVAAASEPAAAHEQASA